MSKYIIQSCLKRQKNYLLIILIPFSLIFTIIFSNTTVWGYADITYEIDFEVYCDFNADSDICGPGATTPNYCCKASETDLIQYLNNKFKYEMYFVNEIYKPVGISFQIGAINIHVENVPKYSIITEASDPGIKELQDWAKANNSDKITLFVLQKIGNFSAVAGYNERQYDSDYYGVFTHFTPDGATIAHELGHHFCLGHTFTFRDIADDGDYPALHDEGLEDTPPDPGVIEIGPSDTGPDAYLMNNNFISFVPDHEWCVAHTTATILDPNSPYINRCETHCNRSLSNSIITQTNYEPATELLMSYYGGCNGPFVLSNGDRIEAITLDQKDRIRNLCIATIPERQAYRDICEFTGGDTDHDGICDFDDNCPKMPNYSKFDADNDEIPDSCDNCPLVSNPDQADMDNDTVGDLCDIDRDGDGCINPWDDDPNNNRQVIGTTMYFGCDISPAPFEPRTAHAGEDSDNDGIPNCSIYELDDDSDGIIDVDDPCPTIVNSNTDDPDPNRCIFQVLGCPFFATEQCFFLCGENFYIKLVSRINPADFIVFDNIAIYGDTFYLQTLPGITTSETARSLTGERFISAGFTPTRLLSSLEFEGPPLALELWSRSPESLVEVLAQYDPDDIIFGDDIANGRALTVQVSNTGQVIVNSTWVFGLNKGDTFLDQDGDSVPDFADNCQKIANLEQRDRDSDGFGDVCDPDFDQNGMVTESEVQFVNDCEGVELTIPNEYYNEYYNNVVPQQVPILTVIKAEECRKADLDGDNDIDEDDTTIATNLFGERPGPSGIDGKIPRGTDQCQASDTSPHIVIDECDSGVENNLLDNGCTMNDLIAQCADGVKNHGTYVSCVALLTNGWKKVGLISGKEKGAIQSCATKSDIP